MVNEARREELAITNLISNKRYGCINLLIFNYRKRPKLRWQKQQQVGSHMLAGEDVLLFPQALTWTDKTHCPV